MKVIEKILVLIVKCFIFPIYWVGKLFKFIASIIEFLLIVFCFSLTLSVIGELPSRWESLVLTTLIYGGAFLFSCIIILAVWRPKEFRKIFK